LVDALHHRPPRPRGTWFGSFTRAEKRLAAKHAVLVLPGGESGQILIDYLNQESGDSGTFVGLQVPLLAGAIRT
jgi:hypothetical protein